MEAAAIGAPLTVVAGVADDVCADAAAGPELRCSVNRGGLAVCVADLELAADTGVVDDAAVAGPAVETPARANAAAAIPAATIFLIMIPPDLRAEVGRSNAMAHLIGCLG